MNIQKSVRGRKENLYD